MSPRGRLAPEAMFPAGVAGVRTRRVTLPGGLALRVAESGAADAPPVVLLHGWGASLYMWRDWLAPLAAEGFRAVAVDLPGHGLSDKPREPGAYTLARQVAVVRALLDAERLRGAPVVAQSMAGTIALELALESAAADDAPPDRLVLVNPAAFGRIGLLRVARLLRPSLADVLLRGMPPRWAVARAHRMVYARPERITPRDIDEYWAPSADPGYAPAMHRLLHEFRWHRQPVDELARRMSALARPPLVVLGGRDRLVRDARSYVDALRRAGAALELLDVPDGGHAVNEEAPELLLPRVLRFLRG